MNRKIVFIALCLAILLLMLSSCTDSGKNNGGGSSSDENPSENPSDTPTPTPTKVFFDNDAGWNEVFCYLYDSEDEFLCEIELSPDLFGIYSVSIPPECKGFVFTDKRKNTTEVLTTPTGARNAFNNLTAEWTTYSTAIKNPIKLGDNLVAVTLDDLDMGFAYLRFEAEMDGVYTFTTETSLEIGILVVEISDGEWQVDSSDWTKFSTPLNQAYLTAGNYYICLFNDKLVNEGLYEVELSYEEKKQEQITLESLVFSDGETTIFFYRDKTDVLSVLSVDGATYSYEYRLIKEGEVHVISLTPMYEGEEFYLGNFALSTLSANRDILYLDGKIKIRNNEFTLCEAE